MFMLVRTVEVSECCTALRNVYCSDQLAAVVLSKRNFTIKGAV